MEKFFFDAGAYIYRQIFTVEPLDSDKIIQLIPKAQSGDIQAINYIWIHEMRLIPKIIKKFTGLEERDDLIQESAIAVRKAITSFDPSLGYMFSTYCCTVIYRALQRYLTSNNLIHTSVYAKTLWMKYKKEYYLHSNMPIEKFNLIFGKKYSIQPQDLMDAQAYLFGYYNAQSLDAPLLDERDEFATVGDLLESPISVENVVLEKMQKQEIENALRQLTLKQCSAFAMHHGFLGYQPMTFDEIAKLSGTSKQAVSALERAAARNLKHSLWYYKK